MRVLSANGAELTMRAAIDRSLGEDTAWAMQGLHGLNRLTSAYEAPGRGAPYAECFITIEKI
ncbi:MAG: hypothetical protein LUE09_13940 [Synergistaceae bacterium]|nr:hypothetical protein [Synergistaceae bacterium]